MIVFELSEHKNINPDQLAEEMGFEDPLNGHGISVIFSEDGASIVKVVVFKEYTIGLPPNEIIKTINLTEEQVESFVTNHSAE